MKKKIIMALMAATLIIASACSDMDFSLNSGKTITQETGNLKLNYSFGNLVKLGKYHGIELKKKESILKDDKMVIAKMAQEANSFKEVSKDENEVIASGDVVNLDFEGFVDGSKKSTESATAKGFNLGIGSGSFIEGFEEQIIGHKVKESFDINLKFPDDYQAKDMAGKKVRFNIKINFVIRDKDVAKNTQYKTVSQWKDAIKKQILEDMDKSATNALKGQAIETVAKFSVVKRFPENLVKQYKNDLDEYLYKPYAQMMKMSLEDMKEQYGLTDETIENNAKNNMAMDMISCAIAKKEGITISAEELKAKKDAMIGKDKTFADEKAYDEADGDETVLRNILNEKVVDFIIKNAKITTLNEKEYDEFSKTSGSDTTSDAEDEDDIELSDDEAEGEEVDDDSNPDATK